MELEEAIKTRRSIRKFQNRKVDETNIVKIIESGMWAPSIGNLQNWYFIVIRKDKMKKEVAKLCMNEMWISTAQVIIVVVSRTDRVINNYGARGEMYHIQNTSACVENMLLRIHDLGLASTWVSTFDEEELTFLLDLPEHIKPVAVLPIGYPGEKVPIPTRQHLNYKVYNEKWGGKWAKKLPKLLR